MKNYYKTVRSVINTCCTQQTLTLTEMETADHNAVRLLWSPIHPPSHSMLLYTLQL